jgi:hypothetical protein
MIFAGIARSAKFGTCAPPRAIPRKFVTKVPPGG